MLWALAVCWPFYSYSDSITPYYGATNNAAANGLQWSMDSVFPSPPGLDVQNVIYNYTIHKPTNEQVDVSVQNKNALGAGYIFRETDTWLPGSLDGTQINKAVPVIPNIPKEAWGNGSITVDGNGSVSNARVIYTYRVDPCYDPQFDPNCPGYKIPIPNIPEFDISTLYDATEEDADIVQYEEDKRYKSEEELTDEEKKAQEEKEELDSKERLEKALTAADNSAMFAAALAQAQMLQTLALGTNVNSYYRVTISGGTYRESITLVDKQIPDNRNGRRNGLAQQLLHTKMVDMQYKK